MTPVRVLVVDDSATVRLLLPRLLSASEYVASATAVAGGEEALALLEREEFDVVILDQEMPGMDGLETLDRLQHQAPLLPVIMYSSLTKRGARLTLDALSKGARTYVTKPSGMGSRGEALRATKDQLLETIVALFEKIGRTKEPPPASVRPPRRPMHRAKGPVQCVVIASSTGGPNIVSELVTEIWDNVDVPILIVQHMPPVFTTMFASRLDKLSPLRAKEAYEGATSQAADIWVAPGDAHMFIRERRADGGVVLGLDSGPRRHGCRPCADTLFESAVERFGGSVLAVVLSGMGKDGLAGSQAVADAGGQVLAQDRVTSVVWSMPGSVVGAGLAEEILNPKELALSIIRRVRQPARPRTPSESASNPAQEDAG